jgi:Tfp pilus assembly protein PilX
MNKLLSIVSFRAQNQKGAAILLTVVLLLIMVTLVTLYTGKIQSFEHQIVINTQNQKWAQASAKAGLNQGLAMLNVNKVWPDSEVSGNLDDNSTFTVSAISEDLQGSR